MEETVVLKIAQKCLNLKFVSTANVIKSATLQTVHMNNKASHII